MSQNKKKQEASLKLISIYQSVFESPPGQKVLQDIISDCGVLSSSLDKDPITMAFNEGRRSVALRLMKILKTDTGKLKKIIDEIEKERSVYED